MFWLDASTTVLIVLYMIAAGLITAVIPLVIVKLLALNAIQAMYIPAVQASVPVLVPGEKLTSGNAVGGVVNSLSSMVGMAVAGVIYGRFGLMPILIVSAVCFAVTAAMDLLIKIPYKKQDNSGGVVSIVKNDISQSLRFIFKEKPILAKSIGIIVVLVTMLSSVLIVGLPVLINRHLNMGMEYVGISQSIMMVGGLAGGIIAGALGSRLTLSRSMITVAIGSVFIVLMGLVFVWDISGYSAYIILTAASLLIMLSVQFFNIAGITFIQKETPIEFTGKIMSFIMMLPFLAQALGQVLYGVLFEQLESQPWLITFGTAILVSIVAILSHGVFKKAEQ
jgi:MFS family permease